MIQSTLARTLSSPSASAVDRGSSRRRRSAGCRSPRAPPSSPRSYEILGISVEGRHGRGRRGSSCSRRAGSRVGQQIAVPGDQAVSDAIRRLYELGNFTDVDVIAERYVGPGVFLTHPRRGDRPLGEFAFEGVRRGWADELAKRVPLLRGRALRPADVDRTEQVIREYFLEKGYRLVSVETEGRPLGDGRTALTFAIDARARRSPSAR
jgi:outer membrane protein insertion porin family